MQLFHYYSKNEYKKNLTLLVNLLYYGNFLHLHKNLQK